MYKKKHFKFIKNKFFVPNVFSIIVYIGDNAEILGKYLRKKRIRWRIATYLKFLKFSEWLIRKDIELFFSNRKE